MENTFALFTSTNLRVHNSFSENYKNSTNKKPAQGRHFGQPLRVTVAVSYASSLWKGPRSLPVGPRSHECDKGEKKYWFDDH